MTKLKLHTPNKADENFRKLAELFPNAVTETIDENGEVVRAIDKDILMQEIAVKVVDGPDERYQFIWPDKKKAILTANAPISKTLRSCREESVDFDNTENLYIEGDNLDVLMYQLERNGYFNVVGLKRKFAIEVDQYDEKEILVDEIFSKSRVLNSELFALDADLVVQLLASFEGKQIYPKVITKDEVFAEAATQHQDKADRALIPDGEYYCEKNIKGFGDISAKMRVADGEFIVLKGCKCCPVKGDWAPEARRNAPIKDDVLMEDVRTNSPSTAGWIVFGCANNGWLVWKDKRGKPIDMYRKNK